MAKKLADDPQARKKAKKALEENPELAQKAKRAGKKALREIAETDTQLGESLRKAGRMEAERDTERRIEEMGEWGHPTTVYPDQYKGPRLGEVEYVDENLDEKPTKKQLEKEHKKVDERGMNREHARTVYPAEYKAPKIDDKDMKKPVSPMVQKHERPVHQENEAIGSAMIEENEKERALELFRSKTEQELKNEYDHKVMELTDDYNSRL